MKRVEDMTEDELLEELKTWDDEVWKKFKEENYETINIEFKVDCD